MTACVDNKEKKGGAAKAVSATLAGVLAVGMVPAVAFATPEGDSAEAEGDIELLDAQTDAGAFNEGKISAYKDGAGLSDTYTAAPNNYTGIPDGPIPTEVQPAGDGVDPVKVDAFYPGSSVTPDPDKVYYGYIKLGDMTNAATQDFKFADGTAVEGSWAADLETPGDYAVVVFRAQGDEYVAQAEKFTVAPADLSQCVVVAGAGNTEVAPIVFNNEGYVFGTANGPENELHIFLNGKEIHGDQIKATIVEDNEIDELAEAEYAGTYKVRLDGQPGSIYEDSETDYIDLVIEPFDLGSAVISLDDVTLSTDPAKKDYGTTISAVNFTDDDWAKDYIKITGYEPTPTGAGTYTATIGVNPDKVKGDERLAASIINSTTASYYVVDQTLTVDNFLFKYDGVGASSYTSTKPLTIDYSAADFSSKPGVASNSFDASKISLELNRVAFEDGTTEVDPSEYELVVYNTETHEIGGTELLAESGTYELRAVLKAEAIDYQFAGSTRVIPVTVTQGVVADADVTFAYEGKVVTGITGNMMTYDGTDQHGDITITVKTTQGAVVDPADYTVTVKKLGADGVTYSEVDGIVGAGDYQVIVTSDKYDITANSSIENAEVLLVHVDQLKPVDYRIAGLLKIDPSSWNSTKPADSFRGEFLPYTGAEIVPVIEYAVADDQGDYVWNVLPVDQYKITGITYNRDVNADASKDTFVKTDAVQAVGTYKFTWDNGYENGNAALGQNFNLQGISGKIQKLVVSDAEYFLDCPTGEWYYDEVLTAANNGWIKGFNNSVFYQPHESIKRGDVCVILARMAGVTLSIDENGGVADKYYETPFSDVDGNLYYAEAIAWAANTGVVTGYDGTTEFCPEEPITREAFATMLARYAANMGIDITGAAGAADEYADADAVSWWAEDAVDWAVSADIMGVDTTVLAPTANISRAETAAMVVRL